MKIKLLLLLLPLAIQLHAQQQTLRFVEQGTGKPVTDADVYIDSVFVAPTNYNGNVKVNMQYNFKTIIVSHINYATCVIPKDSVALRRVFELKKNSNVLNEVLIDTKSGKDTLAPLHLNFSYGDKVARLIEAPAGSLITKLKFRVTNGNNSGVKGLRFLPFKANVYALDTITNMPGKQLLGKDILVENKDGNKWATADISNYNIRIPPQGACIVFIIPAYEDGLYETFWIQSKTGLISAVPNLKHKMRLTRGNSFIYTSFIPNEYGELSGKEWRAVGKWDYVLEAETVVAN